jgi:hypothetical protein
MSAQARFFLIFCGILCVVGLLIVSFLWNADGYFTNAYSPIVQQSQEAARNQDRDTEEKPSGQPRPAGFSEKDIEKQRGNRYATY